MTAIYSGDFNGCGSIKNITSLNLVPPVLPGNGFDKAVYKNATLRVPDDSLDDYKVANGWKNFFTILGTSDIIPEAIELEIAEIELVEGETATLKATITPENTTITTLTWSSSDETIATVDASGKVTAINAGTATITATTSNGLTASCTVTVKAKSAGIEGDNSQSANAITLSISEWTGKEGESLSITAIISPNDAYDNTVTWSSSDSSVASVDASGLVTAIKAGTATITATTSNGLTASCTVTVKSKSAGIDVVDSEGESAVRVEGGNIIAPEGSEVFDLNGRRVKATNLPSGIYIVRIPGGKAVKIMVK